MGVLHGFRHGAILASLCLVTFCTTSDARSDADFMEDIRLGSELIVKSPSDFRGYASRGCGYEHLKKYDLAEKDLLKAIDLKPEVSGLYCHLAAVYYEQGRYQEAASASAKVMELGDKSVEAYNSRLATLCMAQRYDECFDLCRDVIKQFPNNGTAYYFRAICRNVLSSGARREVLSDLAMAKRLKPGDQAIKKDYELFKSGKKLKTKLR
ncbi:MAG: tetratricopeptide repeat protein [Candidatus Obscuribacter sp.]|nr:tetratricopeptide repeat protein [Candidatus Obscuribacter sp.]